MNGDRPEPRPEDPDPGLDIDASFAEIVANFGDFPRLVEDSSFPSVEEGEERLPPSVEECEERLPPSVEEGEERLPPSVEEGEERARLETNPDSLRNLFNPTWRDSLDTQASWDDEGHFIPPDPPLPPVDPRRKRAWIALIGAPLFGLLLIALGVALPGWASFGLACAFIGGFGYLVATMGSGDDHWPGDDGAVV